MKHVLFSDQPILSFSLSLSLSLSIYLSLSLSISRGEEGFYQLQNLYAWAKRPMIPRLGSELHPDLPVSIMFGARSWVYALDTSVMDQFIKARPEASHVGLFLMEATHLIHADNPDQYNDCVREILQVVDSGVDVVHKT